MLGGSRAGCPARRTSSASLAGRSPRQVCSKRAAHLHLRRSRMQDQPRDEARAATVREGGNESWNEAAELIDRPENLPTAAGSRSPSGDVPPGAGEATSGHTSTATRQRRSTSTPGSRVDSEHPTGSSYTSSDAPAGQGSN